MPRTILPVLLLLLLGLLVRSSPAQQPTECETDLTQALQRAIMLRNAAAQEQDAITRYFQREIAKVRQELTEMTKQRDDLKQQLDPARVSKTEEK